MLFITNSLYLLKLHAPSLNFPNHILIKLNPAKDSPLKANKSLSVTSEQVLDVSVSTNTQHTATNITDKSIWCFRFLTVIKK